MRLSHRQQLAPVVYGEVGFAAHNKHVLGMFYYYFIVRSELQRFFLFV